MKDPLILAAAGLAFLLHCAVLVIGVPIARSGRADFRQLYAPGYMVRTGHGREIYDYDAARRYQNAVVSPEDVALPFNHLAYEVLLAAPLSLLSFRQAYLAVLVVNLLLLFLCARLLRECCTGEETKWIAPALVACFLPVAIALVQGQDSILLLTLMLAAALSVERGRDVAAGAFLGLALFKFQFALPMAALVAIWRRRRFLFGFSITAAATSAVSVWLTGTTGFATSCRSLVSMSSNLASSAEQYKFGVYPRAMPNLRGLIFLGAPGASPRLVTVLALLLSLLIFSALGWAFAKRKSVRSFAPAILTAMLVSYHGPIHDATLLVIPLTVMISIEEGDQTLRWLAGTLLLGPTVLFLFGRLYSLLAVPLLVALVVVTNALDRRDPAAYARAVG
jgi:hypothetical protein